MKTQITNENIKSFVSSYCSNKESLPDDLKIPIGKWDVSKVTSFDEVFKDQSNFNEPLEWDMSNATSTSMMFLGCEKFNQPLKWNVKKVLIMSAMFMGCKAFNQPLEWDMSEVGSTSYMFYKCKKFNQPLKWNTQNLQEMNHMFMGCKAFNQPLNWDVGYVEDMIFMFSDCEEFNQPLNWDVSSATDMKMMFQNCLNFNQPLNWNVSNVISMSGMFMNCSNFNQPLEWDMSKVVETSYMFAGCESFNQPLNWDVGNVISMRSMFYDCEEFNHSLIWDVSNVQNMHQMFSGCVKFNSELRGKTEPQWNVSQVKDMSFMFKDCFLFNQPLVWNVTQVIDMSYMFAFCRQFNQPLDWNVNQVESFECMFDQAYTFDQDLTRWGIMNGAMTEYMFYDCGIRQEYLPTLPEPESSPESVNGPPIQVDALGIHKFSSKIDVNKLNDFFKSKTQFDPKSVEDIPNYVRVSLTTMIDELDAYRIESEKGLTQELQSLTIGMDSLENIDAEIKELNIPVKTVQTLDKLYQQRKSLLHKTHTSKALTKIPNYLKKIDSLLVQPSNRKDALEEEKRVLLEIDTLDKERKKIRILQNKKESLAKLLDKRATTLERIGRKNFLEYELKNGKEIIETHRKDLEKIMRNVLKNLNYELFEVWTTAMLYSLDYVEKQPILFKQTYIESFLKDCVHAYEGAGGMSCATGVLERFVVSLMAGCGAVLSVSDNPEYDYIKSIVENGLNKLIPEYILKWYKLHSHAPHKFTTESREQRLDNLRGYLLSFFPDNEELIDDLIPQFAIDVDNDDFEYKKENLGVRIQMNNVYENIVRSKPLPKPRITKKTTMPRVRAIPKNTSKNTKNIKNSKRLTTKALPRPKPLTRKTKKTVLGTAFG